jgi:hypothetical protein
MEIVVAETLAEKQGRLHCHKIDIFSVHLVNCRLAGRRTDSDSFLVPPALCNVMLPPGGPNLESN